MMIHECVDENILTKLHLILMLLVPSTYMISTLNFIVRVWSLDFDYITLDMVQVSHR